MPDINITGKDEGSKILRDLAANAKALHTEMKQLTESMVKYNIEGRVTQATLKGVNEAGKEVVATTRLSAKGEVTYAHAIRDTNKQLADRNAELKRQRAIEKELINCQKY